MADIISIGGRALGLDGWVKVSDVTDPQTGARTAVYQGRIDTATQAAVALAREPHSNIALAVSGAVATLTLTATKDDDESTTPKEDETAQPDVSLIGAMQSVPLYQAQYFGLGAEEPESDALTLSQLKLIEYLLRENGAVNGNEIETGKATEYAAWASIGQKTIDIPTYTLSITYHYTRESKARATELLAQAGTVLSFDSAVKNLPDKLKPNKPEGFEQWLATAPTINYKKTGVDISVSYIGAKAFPNYYQGGTWQPPQLGNRYAESDVNSGSEEE